MGRYAGPGWPPAITPPCAIFCLLNSKTQEGNYPIGVTGVAR
jgi:hypothetical protein